LEISSNLNTIISVFSSEIKLFLAAFLILLMKKSLFLGLVLFLMGSILNRVGAQSQFSGWLATFATIKSGKKTSVHADIQWRSSAQVEHMQTLLIRAGLNYHLNKQWTATAGYAFTYNRRNVNNVNGYAPEHRIWEQMQYGHRLNIVSISHRLRLEQRFIGQSSVQNNELKTDNYAYVNRIRYFIKTTVPFRRQKPLTRGMFALLQEEVFLNFGNTENVNGKTFDQNRIFLALGYRLNRSLDLEAGYMNQYSSGRGDTFTNNHIAQVAAYIRL